MLVGHLTLKVTLINELMLLLYLASSLTAVKHLTSLSTTSCIGPGTHCAQGLTRTLTCSVTFRLFQHLCRKPEICSSAVCSNPLLPVPASPSYAMGGGKTIQRKAQ